jgi:choline transport protein
MLARCADEDVTDYTCAVLAAMALFSGINWLLHARKHYKGPRVELGL